MKKMIGAFALTAALAMGTAPAFAQGTVDTNGDGNAFSDSGSTIVKAKVDNIDPMVRATVPLQVTVVFGSNGASDVLGPSPEAYYIENIGDGKIKVTEAELSTSQSVLTFEAIRLSDITDEDVDGDKIMFYYTTALNNTYLTPEHSLSEAVSSTPDSRYITGAKQFQEETIDVNGKLNITLGGKAYFNSSISQDQLTDTLCNIKYTIASAAGN